MFDNLLFQNAADFLSRDIVNSALPRSLLFSGSSASGKLTAAIELARVLSCQVVPGGKWTCNCRSCLAHKKLMHPDLLLTGPRDCLPEIAAAKKTLWCAVASNASYVMAVRYLFIRSIRKLTARFHPVMWEEDDRAGKAAALTAAIDEQLEQLDPARALPEQKAFEKLLDSLETDCQKLESGFLPDSIPIAHIRRLSVWARLTSGTGKKTVIIENADRMSDSVRNALLKILEEPPENVLFVLTTARRGAVIPTVLSRVRTYSFAVRSPEQQQEVILRVFHEPSPQASISAFLSGFLPIAPQELRRIAEEFYAACLNRQSMCEKTVAAAKGFEPRIVLKLFFTELIEVLRRNLSDPSVNPQSVAAMVTKSTSIQRAFEHITVYNQSPISALEILSEELR